MFAVTPVAPFCCLVKQNYDQSRANLYLVVDAKSKVDKAAPLALIMFLQ